MSENTNVNTGKKEISEKVAVKAIITSYVCYGLILFFLCNLLKNLIQTAVLSSNLTIVTINKLGFLLPAIFGIIISFLIHILSRVCVLDVFRKCKINPEKVDNIVKSLRIFFVLIMLGSIVYSLFTLYIVLNQDTVAMKLVILENKNIFSPKHITQITQSMIEKFVKFRSYAYKDAFISEIFIIGSFLSISSMQKKLINEYNGEYVSNNDNNTEKTEN